MPNQDFEIVHSLPQDYRHLLWETFFRQKGRGIDLACHFPWMDQGSADVWYATLRLDGALVAGLTIRKLVATTPADGYKVAIGLVCVAEHMRGQGVATKLLELALDRLDGLGVAAATLWTGKPGVYARHGFEFGESAWFGSVEMPTPPTTRRAEIRMTRWPDSAEIESLNRGLPPYASYGQRLQTTDGTASVIIIHDPQGVALAEWSGEDYQVVELLIDTMPARWRLNAVEADTLPAALRAAGITVKLEPMHLQMWKHFDGRCVTTRPWLRLLDRI